MSLKNSNDTIFPSEVVLLNNSGQRTQQHTTLLNFTKFANSLAAEIMYSRRLQEMCIPFQVSTLALCPNQPPTQCVQGTSPWVNQPGRTADGQTPSTAKVKVCRLTSSPPYAFQLTHRATLPSSSINSKDNRQAKTGKYLGVRMKI